MTIRTLPFAISFFGTGVTFYLNEKYIGLKCSLVFDAKVTRREEKCLLAQCVGSFSDSLTLN